MKILHEIEKGWEIITRRLEDQGLWVTLQWLFGRARVLQPAFAGADLGQAQKQATNWTAIGMFGVFVIFTLFITKWAAAKTKSAADFYTAGGGITGFQNGLAIAGDYMSAASFLGISGLVFANGFDGLIFSIGWLVGWPVITFLMAERLRNRDLTMWERRLRFETKDATSKAKGTVGSLLMTKRKVEKKPLDAERFLLEQEMQPGLLLN